MQMRFVILSLLNEYDDDHVFIILLPLLSVMNCACLCAAASQSHESNIRKKKRRHGVSVTFASFEFSFDHVNIIGIKLVRCFLLFLISRTHAQLIVILFITCCMRSCGTCVSPRRTT